MNCSVRMRTLKTVSTSNNSNDSCFLLRGSRDNVELTADTTAFLDTNVHPCLHHFLLCIAVAKSQTFLDSVEWAPFYLRVNAA